MGDVLVRVRLRYIAAWSLVAALTCGGAAAQMTDDEFLESLGGSSNQPVDRKRLARMFFSIAATLDGGKSSVQLLQGRIIVPDSSQQAVRSLLETRYEEYARALGAFKEGVSGLLDEPTSMLRLYRALQDGQRTCWNFDLYNRLIETYGSNDMDLMSILSSREACGRLRNAAFQPRVEGIIVEALVDHVYQRAEIADLQEELRDLEQLLEDLREIEASE
jgi:hypothetical protein